MKSLKKRNLTFLVSRHNRVVNAIIDGINSKRVPLPVGRRNNNLPADGKIPDVEFQKNETWVLHVRFTKPHNEEVSFASMTEKYLPMCKNKVVPVVIGYSGKIYYKSK